MKCLEQHVGTAMKFFRFRIHISDTKTEKDRDRCGTARHFNNKSCHSSNLFVYLRVQLIEKSKFMMTVILKVFYETKKHTVSPNYSKL